MILKAIGYAVLYLAINTVATVGVVGMTEHGGDVQVARLSHNVDVLTVEVADLKRKIDAIDGQHVENTSNQNVYFDSRKTAEIEQQDFGRALYAVWVANYGKEKADDMLHTSGVGRASGQP